MRAVLILACLVATPILLYLLLARSNTTTPEAVNTQQPSRVSETEAEPVERPVVRPDVTSRPTGGVVEGVVIYETDPKRRWRYQRHYVADPNKGFLAEAVVALTGARLRRAEKSPPKTEVIDQKDYTFVPEVTTIRAGDRVKFINSDAQFHNVHSAEGVHRFNIPVMSGAEFVETFRRAGGTSRPVRLACNIHPSMRAWVFVFDHPYFQKTSTDGRFRLENVPPGEYLLEVSHPSGALWSSEKIEIQKGQTERRQIRVSPDNKSNSEGDRQ